MAQGGILELAEGGLEQIKSGILVAQSGILVAQSGILELAEGGQSGILELAESGITLASIFTKEDRHKNLSYHYSITPNTGRLKLLHRDEEVVSASWERDSNKLPEAMVNVGISSRPGQTPFVSRKAGDMSVFVNSVAEGKSAVEFAVIDICVPDDKEDRIEIPVWRVGGQAALDRPLTLRWRIVSSCIPKLIDETGTVTFKAGEANATFRSPCVPTSGWWNPDNYYIIQLSATEEGDPAVLFGKNSRVTVYMLNSTKFEDSVRGLLYHNFTEMPAAATKGLNHTTRNHDDTTNDTTSTNDNTTTTTTTNDNNTNDSSTAYYYYYYYYCCCCYYYY